MEKFLASFAIMLLVISSIAASVSGGNDPTYEISGYTIDFFTGDIIDSGNVTVTIKENGDANSTYFASPYWKINLPSTLDSGQNKFTVGVVVNTSNEKIGYNQLIVGSGDFASQTQDCSTKLWHFRGYAVDSSGSYVNGSIMVGIDGIDETNSTEFTDSMWDIYYSPCLISGEIYTFQFTAVSGDKRNYMFLSQVAK